MEKQDILGHVIKQLEELRDTFPADEQFEVNEETALFGKGSSIDSLSLVSLIVDLEALFSDEFGYDISLTDDRAMASEVSPFSNTQSLVNYIHELVNEMKAQH